jgi:ElaA protein
VVRTARFDQLSARTFHDIVRLRLDTFVVEQRCWYPELDGRDLLETTLHAWIEEEGVVVAYLRMYPDDGGITWIGRVVTAPSHRGRGLGGHLMTHALALATRPVRISAQSRLESWYAALGFVRCGDDFLEDGILHTPMRLG